jgi:hypothetical protein
MPNDRARTISFQWAVLQGKTATFKTVCYVTFSVALHEIRENIRSHQSNAYDIWLFD